MPKVNGNKSTSQAMQAPSLFRIEEAGRQKDRGRREDSGSLRIEDRG